MDALQLREEITSKLEKVDLTVLRAIDAMLDVYTDEEDMLFEKDTLGYETDGTPIKTDSFLKTADHIVGDMEAGNSTPAETV